MLRAALYRYAFNLQRRSRTPDPVIAGTLATGAPAEVAARAGNSARVLRDIYLHCIDSQQDHISQQIENALDADASHRPSSQWVKASGYTNRRLHPRPCPLYVREPVPGPAHSPRPPGPADPRHQLQTRALIRVSAARAASESVSADIIERLDPAHA